MVNLTLSAPVSSATQVTVTSSDPSKLKFSTAPDVAGSPSITLTIPINQSNTADFYAQGFANTGTVGYTVTSSGFGTVNSTVTLAPAGLLIQTPGGFGANFSVPVGVDANIIPITGPLVNGSISERQAVAGGQSVSVTVVSSNTAVGTITTSPITIAGGTDNALTFFHTASQGTSTITASAAQFASAQVVGTVTPNSPPIINSVTVGKNLQQAASVLVPAVAGAGGIQVTITSNSAQLLLSASETTAGSAQIVVTIPQGGNEAVFYVQSLSASGTGTYTANATGFGSATGTATFAPSAVVLFPPSVTGSVAQGTATISVLTAILDPSGTPTDSQPLAGGQTLVVSVNSSDTSKATVPATVTVPAGASQAPLPITLKATGLATINVVQPAGWTTPNMLTSTAVVINP